MSAPRSAVSAMTASAAMTQSARSAEVLTTCSRRRSAPSGCEPRSRRDPPRGGDAEHLSRRSTIAASRSPPRMRTGCARSPRPAPHERLREPARLGYSRGKPPAPRSEGPAAVRVNTTIWSKARAPVRPRRARAQAVERVEHIPSTLALASQRQASAAQPLERIARRLYREHAARASFVLQSHGLNGEGVHGVEAVEYREVPRGKGAGSHAETP